MIDPKIETLIKVHETGSFTRASEKLYLTQPAVSQHIKQLESELGIRIFNRAENTLKLTREGDILLKYALRIKTLYQNLQQSLIDEKQHLTRLTIGSTHSLESSPMASVIARYCSLNEGVSIKIITDNINNLYNKLKTYEVDLVFAEGKFADANFNSLLLDTDFLVLAMSKNNPLCQKSMVTFSELKREKLILRLPDSGTRNLFSAHLESQNMSIEEFNVILEVDNISTIKDLVRRNFGVSILARSACLNEIRKGKLIALPVENVSMVREIYITYHRDFEHTQVLQDITRIYNESARLEK